MSVANTSRPAAGISFGADNDDAASSDGG